MCLGLDSCLFSHPKVDGDRDCFCCTVKACPLEEELNDRKGKTQTRLLEKDVDIFFFYFEFIFRAMFLFQMSWQRETTKKHQILTISLSLIAAAG